MNIFKVRRAVRAAVAGGVFFFATNAHAVYTCDGCVVAAVTALNVSVTAGMTALSTLITTTHNMTVQAIKGVGTEVSQGATENAKAIAMANSRVAYDVVRSNTMPRYSITNPCAVVAATAGVDSAVREASTAGATFGRGGTGGGGIRAGSGGAGADLAKAISIAKGAEPAPAPEVTAKLAASGACSAFATGSRATACSAARFSTGQSNPYGEADVRADTLFDGPQKNGERRKKFTVDDAAGSAERVAIEAFIRNMGTPLELRSLGQGELGTDAGRRFLAVKDSYEARMSFAERPMRRHVGMMAPTPDSHGFIARLVESVDRAWVTAYLDKASPNWRTKGISRDDVLSMEVEGRHMNRGWQLRVSSMPPEEVAREQLRTTAFQNVLLWQLNQEVRESGIMLGGLNATAVRSESLPELKAAHSAATR